MLPGCCAVTERMARAADAARTNRLAIVKCFGKDNVNGCRDVVRKFWHLQMPCHYMSVLPPHYLRSFTLWTLRLRKPRSWFHVAAVQQNTDRDYGAHSRLQIQMLYSTVGNGSTVTRLENGLAVHARRHGWWDQGPMRLLELVRKIYELQK